MRSNTRNMMKVSMIFLGLGLLVIRPTLSYADRDHVRVGVDVGVPVGYYGHYDHYYDPYYDPYYGPYYAGPDYPGYVLVSPSISYQPVVVNGVTYYVNNGVYYIYTQYGYQAVATPAGATAPVPVVTQSAGSVATPAGALPEDAISVNIPNDKGGYTTVVLKPSGKGYVGPQGEFYAEFPKVSQLKLMYGK